MPKQDQNTQQRKATPRKATPRKATPIVLSIFSSKLLLRKLPILMPAVAMCGLLALISAFFASADSASDTYAVDSGNQITTEVDGQYYVTLTTSDVNFSVAPSKNENAAKQRVDVGVETNVAGGAKLYLAMGSNSNSLHLNGNTAQSSPVIAAVADGTGVNNFAMNTWGYSTDDQTYSAVPTAAGDPALLATVDGETVGSTSGSVISASVPVYYAAKVDTSIPAGSYSNRVTYSAVVDGGIITSATLTKIEIDGAEVENMQTKSENTLEITTNLMTNTYGTPRVYLETTDPSGYQECGSVVVGRNESGYMTITCKVAPTQAATSVTLHIVPKGSSDDRFCADGTYQPDTSDCEAGDWKWGSFTITGLSITEPLASMQEMTPKLCASWNEGYTTRMVDSRDDKVYWVAKLADGNCWMTQNLDLDLNGRTLTPADSDVSSNWVYNGGWYTSAQDGSSTDPTVQAWDMGDYVWKTPTSTSYCSPGTNLSESGCTSYWQSTSGMTAMTEPRTDAVSVEGNTYDAHYLAGNYYSWEAATAGSGSSLASGDAPSSICPAGWRLPLSSFTYNNTSGSFYYLLNQYGFTSSTGSGTNSITTAPLYFVRSGYVNPGTSYLTDAGRYGYYWSGRASSSSFAYYLHLNSSSVSPSSSSTRYNGRSVRCVATSS